MFSLPAMPDFPLASETLLHLGTALVAGGIIGAERTYHGRAAGFRTHALVCVASAMLMMLPHYQDVWVHVRRRHRAPRPHAHGAGDHDRHRLPRRRRHHPRRPHRARPHHRGVDLGDRRHRDPLRRGALGPRAPIATTLGVGILSVFRKVEEMLPSQRFARFHVRFAREESIPEADLHAFMKPLGIDVASPSYAIVNEGRDFQFGLTLRTSQRHAYARLAGELSKVDAILEFKIEPY